MSTLDVVNQVGGTAANFLDIGGGANADVMAGGARGDQLRRERASRSSSTSSVASPAAKRSPRASSRRSAAVELRAPIVIRLDGTNAEEGRQILLDAGIPADKLRSEPTMLEAARAAVRIADRRTEETVMAIFVNENTKVIVQGLTGGQGKFHGLRNRDYGTQVVGGVTPGKGGQDVEGIPVFDSVADAVEATGATASFVAVPPKAAPAAILEAAAAGIGVRRVHHRGHPGAGRGEGLQHARPRLPGHPPARPELPGHHQPRQVQHRHHRRRDRPAADRRTARTSASSAAPARSPTRRCTS